MSVKGKNPKQALYNDFPRTERMWALPVLRELKNWWDKCTEKKELTAWYNQRYNEAVHSVYRKEKAKGSRLPRETEIEGERQPCRVRGRVFWRAERHHCRPKGEYKVLIDRRRAVWSLKQDWRHFTPALPLSGILQMLSVCFSSPYVCLLCLIWNQNQGIWIKSQL